MIRVAVYASTWASEQGLADPAVSAQVVLCEGYAASRGWRLAGPPYSEGDLPRRADLPAGLARLLVDAGAGQFEVVLVHDLSRLGLTARGVLLVVRRLAAAGVGLATVAEELDPTDPGGARAWRMLQILARLDATQGAHGGEATPSTARRQGLVERAGRLPFGYLRGERLGVDLARADTVRAIFAWRAVGDSLTTIADRLTSQGVPTARGGRRWYASTVRGILAQEAIYRGGRGEEIGQWPIILDPADGASGILVHADSRDAEPQDEPRSAQGQRRVRDWAVWQ